MSEEPLASVPVGQRVTVRRLLDDGRPTDVVGVVSSRDEESVTLETRHGPVRVMLASVQVHRLVRPVPWRIANFLRRGKMAVLGLECLLGPEAPTRETAELIDLLLAADTPVFLLAGSAEDAVIGLETAGMGHLAQLILSPVTDQPGSDLFALAHARVQDQLGATVAAGEVHFTAADPQLVESARQLGWQARIFTPPAQ